jgi:hypothetical protein
MGQHGNKYGFLGPGLASWIIRLEGFAKLPAREGAYVRKSFRIAEQATNKT